MSPEIYEGKSYTYPSDVWSIGVILFQLFTGTNKPINFRNFKNLDKIQLILNQNFKFKKKYVLIIQNCLQKNPENRPIIKNLLVELKSYQNNLEPIKNE